MSKYLKKPKLKDCKSYYKLVLLEKKIKTINRLRDEQDKEGNFIYPWIMRFIIHIFSKYYTMKWELWYDEQ